MPKLKAVNRTTVELKLEDLRVTGYNMSVC